MEWRIYIESTELGVDDDEWDRRLDAFVDEIEADPVMLGAVAAGMIGHLGAVFLVEADSVSDASAIGEARFLATLRKAAGDLGPRTLRLEVEPEDYEPLSLVGASDAARILGVSRQRFYQLLETHLDFPAAIANTGRGAVWDRRAIVAWGDKPRPAGRTSSSNVRAIKEKHSKAAKITAKKTTAQHTGTARRSARRPSA